MGGGDLNLKKSWHPSTFANLEKVWKAEQKHDTEQKKIEQLQQELKEERAREEMQKTAIEAGAVKKKDDRVDWLYSGPAASVNREEYLLGKKIDKVIDPTLVEAEREKEALASGAGALFVENSSSTGAADLAVKIREDPLFLIKQKEVEAKKRLASNPIKLKRLQQLLDAEGKNKSSSSGSHKKKKKHKRGRDQDSESPPPSRRARESNRAPPSPPRTHAHHSQSRTCDTTRRQQSSSVKQSSTSRHQPYSKPRSRTKQMDPEELERRRQEMIADAKEHDKHRGRRLRLHEELEKSEKEVKKSQDFLQSLRVQSLSTSSSLGDRIHRNINAVQRTSAKLDSHFMSK